MPPPPLPLEPLVPLPELPEPPDVPRASPPVEVPAGLLLVLPLIELPFRLVVDGVVPVAAPKVPEPLAVPTPVEVPSVTELSPDEVVPRPLLPSELLSLPVELQAARPSASKAPMNAFWYVFRVFSLRT